MRRCNTVLDIVQRCEERRELVAAYIGEPDVHAGREHETLAVVSAQLLDRTQASLEQSASRQADEKEHLPPEQANFERNREIALLVGQLGRSRRRTSLSRTSSGCSSPDCIAAMATSMHCEKNALHMSSDTCARLLACA